MALSGTVNTSKYDGRYLRLSWTATQSVANNTSTIKWTLSAVGGNSSWYKTGPVTCTINGTTVYSSSSRVSMYTGTIDTGSITISHNTDGSKSFSISIQAAIYTNAVNCTGSGTFTLDKIARTPSAPSTVTATANNGNYVSIGDTVTIRWSGASGVITGYNWAYRWYKQGSWGSWSSTKTVSTSSTSGSATQGVTSTSAFAGDKIQFRVQAANGSLTSSWVSSNSLTVVGGMRFKVNGSWEQGLAFVNVNGTWKRAQHVYVKVNGAWEESV